MSSFSPLRHTRTLAHTHGNCHTTKTRAQNCVLFIYCVNISAPALFSSLIKVFEKNSEEKIEFQLANTEQKNAYTMEILDSLTPELFIERQADVLEAISNGRVRAKIPLISNLDSFDQLNDGQLVRFRGLVQNMFDPEIYLERYQIKDVNNDQHHACNGKYRDNVKLKVRRCGENVLVVVD